MEPCYLRTTWLHKVCDDTVLLLSDARSYALDHSKKAVATAARLRISDCLDTHGANSEI